MSHGHGAGLGAPGAAEIFKQLALAGCVVQSVAAMWHVSWKGFGTLHQVCSQTGKPDRFVVSGWMAQEERVFGGYSAGNGAAIGDDRLRYERTKDSCPISPDKCGLRFSTLFTRVDALGQGGEFSLLGTPLYRPRLGVRGSTGDEELF